MMTKNTVESVKAWLSYFRTVLADAMRPTLSTKQRTHDLSEGWSAKEIDSKVARELFDAFMQKKKNQSKGRPEIVDVIIVPSFISPKVLDAFRKEGKKTAQVYIPARMDINGKLFASEIPPWIPREILAPSEDGVSTISTVDKVDEWLTFNPYESTKMNGIAGVVAYAEAMLAGVKTDFNDENLAVLKDAVIFHEELSVSTTKNVIDHYDSLAKNATVSMPLVEMVLGSKKIGGPYSARELFAHSKLHLGSMSPKYQLADSQRLALTHHLAPRGGSISAVNGPPGTGKTTLLQSVLASELVGAVVRDQPFPVIMASSATNQAITNILKAFAEVEVDGADPYLAKRWISDVSSFGIYATGDAEAEVSKFHVFNLTYGSVTGFFAGIENRANYERMRVEYLSTSNQYLHSQHENVDGVVESLKQHILVRHRGLQTVLTALESVLIDTGADVSRRIDESISRWLATKEEAVARALSEINNFKNTISSADQAILLANTRVGEVQSDLSPKQTEIAVLNEEIKRVTLSLKEMTSLQQSWSEHVHSVPKWMEIIHDLGWESPLLRRQQRFWLNKKSTSAAEVEGSIAAFKSQLSIAARQLSEVSDQANVLALKLAEINRVLHGHTYDKEAATISLANAERTYANLQHQYTISKAKYADIETLLFENSTSIAIGSQDTFWGVLHKTDKSLRFEMFYLAVHYWEGKYLNSLNAAFDGTTSTISYKNLDATYRRWAMLTPVLISTFHSAPRFLKKWPGYFEDTIDLLIVDEAGQVSPEIAANVFQLCKRAIVVGDIYQIEPVFSTGVGADIAKAKNKKIITTEDDFTYHANRGRACSSGSVMKLAREACCHAEGEQGGITLVEHYRCVPELVSYCNEIVYERNNVSLIGKRQSIPDESRCFPAWGWAQVNGTSNTANGGHQNENEIMSILSWISDNKDKLEKHYKLPLKDIVGVITPFRSQKDALIKMANKILGYNHGVIIGTVHALQGAAREVIIFSPRYGTNHKGGMSFIDDQPNLLNVAVSRAKDSFLVFGNMRLFNAKSNSPSGVIAKKIFESEANQLQYVRSFTSAAYNETTERLSGTDAHLNFFEKAVESAVSTIAIASPYITSKVIEARQGRVMQLLKSAVDRGVNVTVYLDSNGAGGQMDKGRLSDASLVRLRETSANIRFTDRREQQVFHNKTIAIDDHTIIEGSFNWLSAPRYSSFEKLECSLLYAGPKAFQMIDQFMEDMTELCKTDYLALPTKKVASM